MREWAGMKVDGIEGRTLGKLVGLHVDAESGEPRWALIRIGPIAGCTAIPYEHLAEAGGRLWAAYGRDQVRDAPRFRPNEALTALQELELCGFWEIREGKARAAEVGDRSSDQISAVPAEA